MNLYHNEEIFKNIIFMCFLVFYVFNNYVNSTIETLTNSFSLWTCTFVLLNDMKIISLLDGK